MRSLGDRRTTIRLEIVGALWGTLHMSQTARVVNVSRGGALVMSPIAMPEDAAGPVKLTVDGQPVVLDARVRHQRHIVAAATEPAHYLIGLEFSNVPAAVEQILG